MGLKKKETMLDKVAGFFGYARRSNLDDLVYELRRAARMQLSYNPVSSVEDAVESDPIASRAVRYVVDRVKGLEVYFEKNKKVIEHKELRRLFTTPHVEIPELTFTDLMEWLFYDYMVFGKPAAFKEVGASMRVMNWHPLDGSALRPYSAKDAGMKGVWEYKIVYYEYGGKRLPVESVLFAPFFTTRNRNKGTSPLKAALSNVRGNVATVAAYANFLEKKGTPGGALLLKDGYEEPNEIEKKKIIDSFNERHSGPGSAGNLLIPPKGFDFKEFSANLGDNAYGRVLELNREAIAILAGVPMTLLNAGQDTTFANQEQGKEAVAAATLLPYLRKLEVKFTNEIARPFDPAIEIKFDKTELESALARMQAEADIDKTMVTASIDERRKRAYNLPPLKNGVGNQVFLQGIQVPIGEAPDEDKRAEEPQDPLLIALDKLAPKTEPGEDRPYPNFHACRINDPDKYKKKRYAKDARKHNGKYYDVIYGQKSDGDWEDQAYRYDKKKWSASEARSHCKSHDGKFEAASDKALSEIEIQQRASYLTAKQTQLQAYKTSTKRAIKKLFKQQGEKVLAELQNVKDDLSDLPHTSRWVDWTGERRKYVKAMHPVLLGIIKDSGKAMAKYLGGEFKEREQFVASATLFAEKYGERANNTTYRQLDETVRQIMAGEKELSLIAESVTQEICKLADIDFQDWYSRQENIEEEEETKKGKLLKAVGLLYLFAQTVRTEVGGHGEAHNAMGYGDGEGMRQNAIEEREWLISGVNTRDSHVAMDGQRRGLDEPFESGLGNQLMYPGDAAAPPEDSINCQCFEMPVTVRSLK